MVRPLLAPLLAAAILSACTARPVSLSPAEPLLPEPVQAAAQRPAPESGASSGLRFDPAPHIRFILDSQLGSGAIAMTPRHLSINPYFANLAAYALLLYPGHLEPVERYLDWYLRNLNQDGTIHDYRVEEGQEISTGQMDSTDSYAATFLSLVAAWVRAGGDPEWVRENRADLDRVAGAIVAVTDRDGLTWAKPGYHLKLLMDNCEVYRGWRDWSGLMREMGEWGAAVAAAWRAERLYLSRYRFRLSDGTWGWALDRAGITWRSNPHRFYPDAVAQVFPLIWGLSGQTAGYRLLDRVHPSWRNLQAADFPWLLPAFASAVAGDTRAAAEALEAARLRHPNLHWPWFIAESAWVLRTWDLIR